MDTRLGCARAPDGTQSQATDSVAKFAYGDWDDHLGELLQGLYSDGAAQGIVIEFDADAHPQRGEVRAGAAPLEAIHFWVEAD